MFIVYHSYIITCNGGKMVVVSHLFSFFDKIRETVPIPGCRLPDLELSFPDSPFIVTM